MQENAIYCNWGFKFCHAWTIYAYANLWHLDQLEESCPFACREKKPASSFLEYTTILCPGQRSGSYLIFIRCIIFVIQFQES